MADSTEKKDASTDCLGERLSKMLSDDSNTDTLIRFPCGRTMKLHSVIFSLSSHVLADMLRLASGKKEINVSLRVEVLLFK